MKLGHGRFGTEGFFSLILHRRICHLLEREEREKRNFTSNICNTTCKYVQSAKVSRTGKYAPYDCGAKGYQSSKHKPTMLRKLCDSHEVIPRSPRGTKARILLSVLVLIV